MSVSIVIPAYNEERRIGICLKSICLQNFEEKFEVIIVDNKSTDKTIHVAKRYSTKLNLKIITETKKGRGAARATGFDAASGSIIVSADADIIAPPSWLNSLLAPFKDPTVVATTGVSRFYDCDDHINFLFNHIFPHTIHFYRMFSGFYILNGFNFAIRKSAYIKSGGFKPNLNAGEDIDISRKTHLLGKIVYVPDAWVEASGRRYHKGFINGLIPYAKMNYQYFILNKKNDIYLEDIR